MESDRTFTFKMVLIGDGAVGKTSIAKRYLKKGFQGDYIRTIGADFYIQQREYDLKDVGRVALKWMIWDLGGQPAFNEVRGAFYKGAKAALVVYDISRPETFHNLPNWINEFWEKTGGSFPFVLVANKIDLRNTPRDKVSREAGIKYAKKLSDYVDYEIPYMETSAKEDLNIDEAFTELAGKIIEWVQATQL